MQQDQQPDPTEANLIKTGLTAEQVAQSRMQHGENIFSRTKKTSEWVLLARKFKEPLILVLIIAGLASIAISCYEYWGLHAPATVFFEPVGLFAAVLLATGLAFIFEHKADRAFAILNRTNDLEPVKVVRDANNTTVARRDVVKGDIVIIETGDEVPADGILLLARDLGVDESTLTGEPIAHKTTDPALFDANATYPGNMVLRGTKILEGNGILKVSAVGDDTENGKVHRESQIDNSVKTPLNEQLERLGTLIARFAYCVAAAILIGRLITYFYHYDFAWLTFIDWLLKSVMLAVALIAVAVPEGLPMAVTLALAYSMRRLLRNGSLVRKMHACETMGATTVICTDKTGTLTQNRMTVTKTVVIGQPPAEIVAQAVALNSTAVFDCSKGRQAVGNPTECALITWLYNEHKTDVAKLREDFEIVDRLPFSTENKYMATLVRMPDNRLRLFVKGAPEIVLARCGNGLDVAAEKINDKLLDFQQHALRTLALAYADVNDSTKIFADKHLADGINLTAIAITAIADPVRKDVPDAVKTVLDAGIGIKIVTGDTPATATEIGRQVHLWDDAVDNEANITTGPEIAAMSDDQLQQRVGRLKIIARARPLDKKRLVRALQRNNQVVAVTGDGTNDAPALKAAHVGLSMGDGTSVAKDASDITITDNSFASIAKAVMWGRSLYLNIQRFVLFQITINIAACLVVLVGAFTGTQTPLTVTQMLWVNLIMDTFAAMALASLPPSPRLMAEKPRSRSAFIITRPMWRNIIGTGVLFFGIMMCLLWFFHHYGITSVSGLVRDLVHGHLPGHDENALLTVYEITVFFTIFVLLQFWNLFNARGFDSGKSSFSLTHCTEFVTILMITLFGQIFIVTAGGPFFSVTPLSATDWLILIAATSPVALVPEMFKKLIRK